MTTTLAAYLTDHPGPCEVLPNHVLAALPGKSALTTTDLLERLSWPVLQLDVKASIHHDGSETLYLDPPIPFVPLLRWPYPPPPTTTGTGG